MEDIPTFSPSPKFEESKAQIRQGLMLFIENQIQSIDKASMSPMALLIIDMQHGMSTQAAGTRNNPGAEAVMAALLGHWRLVGEPVVHTRHISRTPGSVFWPGQAGVEFQASLAPFDCEHVVEKNVPDAFINTGLERW